MDQNVKPDLPAWKMPTGISSLDPVMDGGIPPGSLVLLLGEIGAGTSEFIYSSLLSVALKKQAPKSSNGIVLPSIIRYITITKMSEDIKREMALSFHADLLAGRDEIQFEDLSQVYFDASVVPVDWYSKGDIRSRLKNRTTKDTLSELANTLERDGENNLVVLDSLTDLASQYANSPRRGDLLAFMRGLQRITKQWNTTVYMPLTTAILKPADEQELADIADAVILFRWEESQGSRRQRVMYFEKFRGLMPHLEEKDLVKFSVKISSAIGFEVSNIRVII